MKWVNEILVEAGRVFVQATQITMRLFWYATLAIVAIVRRSGFQLRDFRLHGPSRDEATGQIVGKRCPVCGAENEPSVTNCFVCGHQF